MTLPAHKLTLALTAAITAAVIVFLTGPRGPMRVEAARPAAGNRTVRGAFHIHTTRSGGALDKDEVAAAAARSGLQFAIFAEHGTGDRVPDPPSYLHGVLCLDGVEVSTNQGHYIGIGIAEAPYPLGGDAASVAEDINRLGGFGVAAHPVSPRAELAWTDWTIKIDAMEWLNADSEWRDERRLRLARSLLDYSWRPTGALASLLDRPVSALDRWDHLVGERPVVGLAGHDAHGGFGAETGDESGRRFHIPSYEASFRTFSLHAMLDRALTGDAVADAKALIAALRGGAVFTVIDAVASPAVLDFAATLDRRTVSTGGVLPEAGGPATFSVRAGVPDGATTTLKRNGQPVAQRRGGVLEHRDERHGAYRVEIEIEGSPGTPPVPWIVSNPIYRTPFAGAARSEPARQVIPAVALTGAPWRIESDPGSRGSVAVTDQSVTMRYRLKPEPRASQFVALAVDLEHVPQDVDAIALRGRASVPMRVSVQLRFNEHDQRWGSSVYFDGTEREVALPLSRLRYLGGTGGAGIERQRPLIANATSLLFVLELTNTAPGSEGSLTLREVTLAR